MPRHSRRLSSTHIYHVVIKGADRQLLFNEHKDYLKYLELLQYYKEVCNFQLYAFCLMSNHVHLLIQEGPIPLEGIFRRLNTSYATWFNMKYNRTGFLQNDRYFSEPVDTTCYFLTALRYIHFNPTKAGLENTPGSSYPWSSYYDYNSQINDLIDISYVLNLLGGIDEFRVFHKTTASEECLDIDQMRRRLPDDVARDIIKESCHCNSPTEFQNMTKIEQKHFVCLLHEKGISIRQMNRLTGIPRGLIQKMLHKDASN